jgi:hypothetical protein
MLVFDGDPMVPCIQQSLIFRYVHFRSNGGVQWAYVLFLCYEDSYGMIHSLSNDGYYHYDS